MKNRKTRMTLKRGQAFVEFAIVMPVFMFFLLCFIQLILIMHARLMLEYASFCAARAAVVSRGSMEDMKMAVAEVMAPFYYSTPDMAKWAASSMFVKTKVSEESGDGPLKIIILNSPSPLPKWMDAGTQSTFQLSEEEKNLKIRIDYDYEMKIPLANYIINDLKAGLLGDESTLSPHFYRPEGAASPPSPTIRLSATCSMRLTTLSTPA